MLDLRKLVESDQKYTLEGDFSLPVFLTDPDGNTYDTNTDGNPLSGQVLYDSLREDGNGEPIMVKLPVVTLRLSTLPVPIEVIKTWAVQIPIVPDREADKKTFLISEMRSREDGASIGFVRLYLQEVVQS